MDWLTKNKNKAMELPREKRQEFMDYMFKGENVGNASAKSGIDSDIGAAILMLNIEELKTKTLRTESL